jgi:glycosyltransferase involved in cell wall biosynthesis
LRQGVLYISYDGMLEPLGQSQVLAYQERLAASNPVHLLSFEKPEDWADEAARSIVAQRMKAAGIHWHPRRYHKRPSALATAYDILVGIITGLWVILRYRVRVVHARSYVAGVMALVLKRLTGIKFVFDMRGFWADERVDGGLWPRSGRMFRVAKWFERRFLLAADHVISLTHAAVREMEKFPYLQHGVPPVTVIPTCADLDRFRPEKQVDRSNGFVLGYVGSAGTWYQFDAVVACFAALLKQRPDARFLIVNRGEHEYIREQLIAGGVPLDLVEIRAASHAEVPMLMGRMNAGVFFIKPVFSKQASAPTKLGEFLGCGIPCLANRGVGDMAEILEGENVGIAVDGVSPKALQAGLARLLELVEAPDITERCVAVARQYFSLEEGIRSYKNVYRMLIET